MKGEEHCQGTVGCPRGPEVPIDVTSEVLVVMTPRGGEVVSDRPMLQWSPVAGATRYEVTLLKNGEPLASIETTETTLSYPEAFPSLEPAQTYRLEVKILDEIDYRIEAEKRHEIEEEEFDSSVLDFRLINAETRADLANELAPMIADTTPAMDLLNQTLELYEERDMATARVELLTHAATQCNFAGGDLDSGLASFYHKLYIIYRDVFKLKIENMRQRRDAVFNPTGTGDPEPELRRCVMNLLPTAPANPPDHP